MCLTLLEQRLTDGEVSYKFHKVISNITYPFRRFFEWFIKVCQYSVVLWKDYDWDGVYIWVILKYKLERTRKCLVEDPYVGTDERRNRIEKRIRTCELLLDRIIKNEYFLVPHEQWERKWLGYDSSANLDVFVRDINKPMSDRQRKELFAIGDYEKQQRNQDLDLLFKILKRNSQEWWS